MPDQTKKVLHSRHGNNFMEIVDHNEIRSLYFRNSVVQSRIALQAPHRLVLKYTHYMMAASLLLQPTPTKVLLIGVGAGALLHFFNHFLPHCQIDAVDCCQEVIEIAQDFFALPQNDQITIHCQDGLDFLSQYQGSKGYDLILIDAFNDDGMAKNIYSREFLRLAKKNLLPEGIICCNLWSGNIDLFNHVQKAIQKNSANSVFIPVRKRENVIAILLQNAVPWEKICPPAAELGQLRRKYGFDFKEVSCVARKNNMKLAERLQFLIR